MGSTNEALGIDNFNLFRIRKSGYTNWSVYPKPFHNPRAGGIENKYNRFDSVCYHDVDVVREVIGDSPSVSVQGDVRLGLTQWGFDGLEMSEMNVNSDATIPVYNLTFKMQSDHKAASVWGNVTHYVVEPSKKLLYLPQTVGKLYKGHLLDTRAARPIFESRLILHLKTYTLTAMKSKIFWLCQNRYRVAAEIMLNKDDTLKVRLDGGIEHSTLSP